jgi:hypothetical protein
VKLSAGGAGGIGPVTNGEGVFCLGPRLGIPSEEARQEGVGSGCESVDGELPSERASQAGGTITYEFAADWSGNVGGDITGQPVHAFLNQLSAWSVKVERVTPGVTLKEGETHGALLEESGGRAAFAKCRESTNRVVAHYHPCAGEIEQPGGGLEGEDSTKCLSADLVFHVVSAREGSDDDLAVRACPPPNDRPPAVHGGVPGYEHDPEVARGVDQEGSGEGAGDRGPERAACLGIVFEDLTDEDCSLAHGGRHLDERVVHRVTVRADDRGDQSHEGKDVREAGGVMLNATPERSKLRERGLMAEEEVLQKGGQAGLLVGRDGDSSVVGVDSHARVDHALGWQLALIVAEAETEVVSQAMPVALRA